MHSEPSGLLQPAQLVFGACDGASNGWKGMGSGLHVAKRAGNQSKRII
jgi:hypothetical protein